MTPATRVRESNSGVVYRIYSKQSKSIHSLPVADATETDFRFMCANSAFTYLTKVIGLPYDQNFIVLNHYCFTLFFIMSFHLPYTVLKGMLMVWISQICFHLFKRNEHIHSFSLLFFFFFLLSPPATRFPSAFLPLRENEAVVIGIYTRIYGWPSTSWN